MPNIIVISYRDPQTNRKYVSHGLNVDTLQNVPLPPEEFESFVRQNCVFCPENKEYYIKD